MPHTHRLVPALCALALGAALVPGVAHGLTSVTADNGATWQINDARRPGLDTGSIRNVSNSRLEAFGNLFVKVAGGSDPMNGQMLRGFGLTEVTPGAYASTASVRLDGVTVSRRLDIDRETSTGLFFDTLTNTTAEPITVATSFGGSLGVGTESSATAGVVTTTSSGDDVLDTDDTWLVATSAGNYRPTGVVVGTEPTRLGDQQNDPFTDDYATTGSGQNNPGFVRELTIEPGATASLLHYVYVGARGDTSDVVTTTTDLAADPDLGTLGIDQLCTVANWDLASLPDFDPATCAGADPLQLPAAPLEAPVRTSIDYDVTGKTVADLQRDMEAGLVTSVEITQAYLDRIEAYDQVQLGFKSFIHVSELALEEAAAADAARAEGRTGPLLGIPIAVKDLYDVEGLPNTGGVQSLAAWKPESDAWQIAKLREAGAVFLGKTNLSEFANSGSFSESGFMQTWNGLYPSKTSFGSSGGSATAVAAELAPIALGTQTGVSLYAPSTGGSLATFRGTDGLTSAEGVMPLTWGQDYAGPMGQTVLDLALLLDATATQRSGNNPDDILTNRVDNTLRPDSFTAGLDADSLQGKRIGYLPASFTSSQISDDPTGADTFEDAKAALEAAGAELVELDAPPARPAAPGPITGNSGAHGWTDYINSEPTFPMRTPAEVWKNLANLPYNVSGTSVDSRVPYDEQSVANYLTRRDLYKEAVGDWMAEAGVDAVAYPGFISQMGNNDATSAVLSSDRATGVLTSNVGLPTVVVPIGETSLGYSNSLQLVGPAWTDAEVLAMGHAVEQHADARVRTAHAPALEYTGPAESLLTLELTEASVEHGAPAQATVTVTSSRKVTGEVSIEVDGQVRTGSLTDGTATIALPTDLATGRHLVVARFSGNAKVAASEAAAQLQVTAADQVVTLDGATKVAAGTTATLTVTALNGTSPVTEGTVLLLRGSTVVGQGSLTEAGTASVKVSGLGVGKHQLTAMVTASRDHGAATSTPHLLRVVKSTPTVRAKLAAKRVTATITAPSSVTGKIRVKAQGSVLGTAKVKKGKATFRLPKAKRGLRKVTVIYLGSDALRKAKVTVKR